MLSASPSVAVALFRWALCQTAINRFQRAPTSGQITVLPLLIDASGAAPAQYRIAPQAIAHPDITLRRGTPGFVGDGSDTYYAHRRKPAKKRRGCRDVGGGSEKTDAQMQLQLLIDAATPRVVA